MELLRIFSIDWSSETAGPSPDGTRTELFLKGCQKAADGNPCQGCFNPALWNSEAEKAYPPAEVAEQIAKFSPNKFLTIVGGEPTDQLEALAELCTLLKQKGFHIMVFSWRTMDTLLFSDEFPDAEKLMRNIDILIDGEYDSAQHIYDAEAGMIIGSGNQVIWDLHEGNIFGNVYEGVRAGDVHQLAVDFSGGLHLLMKEKYSVKRVICPGGVGLQWPAA